MLISFWEQARNMIKRLTVCSWAGHVFMTDKRTTECGTCGKWKAKNE